MYLVNSKSQLENLTQVRVENPDLRSNFKLTFKGLQIQISTRLDARNTMVFLAYRCLCWIRR